MTFNIAYFLYATEHSSFGHAPKRYNVCRRAPAQFSRLHQSGNRGVSGAHDLAKPTVHFKLGPVQALEVLRPLEVTSGYAASVGQDIRDDRDAALLENLVGFWKSGCVCRFDNHLGPNFARHVAS